MYADNFKSSSLAYLSNFNYGRLMDSRKIDYLNEQSEPVIMELDISKAPKVGEEATLTCTIASLHDVADYYVSIAFHRRLGDNTILTVPGSELLLKGALQWQGNLKRAQPTIFTTTINFPEEGDWEIYAAGKSHENIDNHNPGYSDNLEINISSVVSSYGWKPLYVKTTTTTPINTPVITTTPTSPPHQVENNK